MMTRRHIFLALGATTAFPAMAAPVRTPVVTLLGDSITAGLGLPAKDALPAKLQSALTTSGHAVVVRAAGVSGDTTAGGLARLDFSVQNDTRICIVELGGNDYLQSVDPKIIQSNLTQIVTRLRQRGMKVIVLGGKAPMGSAGAYGRAFNAAFLAVGKVHGVVIVPDFLGGVLGDSSLVQQDGVHPNAAGVRLLVDRLAPIVKRLL